MTKRRLAGTVAVRAACGAVLLAVTGPPAQAVILYESPTRNTSAPSVGEGLAGWNLQGQWGNYLGTPIAPQYFITGKHFGASTSITVGSQTYSIDTTFNGTGHVDDPLSDLRICRITGTFSSYAPLYDASADGSEENQTLTVIGRGTQRGDAVTVTGASVSDLRGWQWGTDDHVQSWGRNVVSFFSNYIAGSPDSLLVFAFNRVGGSGGGITNECALSAGDSGGGVFINVGGVWKLAGISYAVTNYFSHTGGGDAGFAASIFDRGGLYYGQQNNWTYIPDEAADKPGASYASRISARLDWINGVIPESGSAAVVALAGLVLLRRRGRR